MWVTLSVLEFTAVEFDICKSSGQQLYYKLQMGLELQLLWRDQEKPFLWQRTVIWEM